MKRFILSSVSSLNVLLLASYQLVVLANFGFSRDADIYFASLAIPGFINALVYSVLTFSVLPAFSRIAEERRSQEARELMTLACLCLLILYAGVYALTMAVSQFVFPGFFPEFGELFLQVSRLQLVAGLLAASGSVVTVIAQSQERFRLVETIQVLTLLAGICLLLVLAAGQLTPLQVARIDVARGLLFLIVMLLLLRCLPSIRWQAGSAYRFLSGARSLLLGNVFLKSLPVFDRSLASLANPGELSVVHFVQQLAMALQRIFSRVIAIPVLVSSSRASEMAGLAKQYHRSSRLALFCGLGSFLLLLGIAVAAWQMWQDVPEVSLVLLSLLAACGLFVAGPGGQVSAGFFYSQADTKTPMMVSSCNGLLSLVLRILLAPQYGIVGLLLGSSLHQLSNWLCLHLLAARRIGKGNV